jgi:signal transduction histidine kinase
MDARKWEPGGACPEWEAMGPLSGAAAAAFDDILQAILGFGQLTLDQLDPAQEASRLVEQMMLAATRGTRLTQGLHAFSRRQVLALEAVDLGRIVREAAARLRPFLGGGIELDLRLDAAELRIWADAWQVEQVVHSLASNALEAIGRAGRVTLATGRAVLDLAGSERPDCTLERECARLSVTDTGAGILPEHREKIFDPFFSTKGPGRGLGLASAHGIVRQHGGAIGLLSEAGAGSTFSVFLPLAP